MDALEKIAKKYGLFILEDSAQSLGAKFREKYAGTFGLGGVFSFYPAKTLGCLGDGGCIVTNDDKIYNKCKMYRDHGRDDKLEAKCWCLNSRLDNIQAAILDYKLKRYDEEIERRRQIAAIYQKELHKIEELVLPPGPTDENNYYDIYQNYEIETKYRDKLKLCLKDNGIDTIIQWGGKAVHQMKELGFDQTLPFTNRLFKRLLLLPINSSLSERETLYVCSVIQNFFEKSK